MIVEELVTRALEGICGDVLCHKKRNDAGMIVFVCGQQ